MTLIFFSFVTDIKGGFACDLTHREVKLLGPKDSPYDGGEFLLSFDFSSRYPFICMSGLLKLLKNPEIDEIKTTKLKSLVKNNPILQIVIAEKHVIRIALFT